MNVTDEYLEARVMTARPEELHLMVVDGAIRQATAAEEALRRESPDFEAAHRALVGARKFVVELISGLDEEREQEVVRNLKRLFAFVYQRLNDADLHHDPGRVGDALRILRAHRETWQQLMDKLRSAASTNAGKDGTPREWSS